MPWPKETYRRKSLFWFIIPEDLDSVTVTAGENGGQSRKQRVTSSTMNMRQRECTRSLEKLSCWLVLCHLDVSWSHWRGEKRASIGKMPQWDRSIGKPVRHFFFHLWLMWEGSVHCGWCLPWSGHPGFYKKTSRGSHEEKVSNQHSSAASASAPISRFLLCLSSCPDFF